MIRCTAAATCLLLMLGLTTFAGTEGLASEADRKGVEAAVLDYVEGVYNAEPDRIRRSVHKDLQKFGFGKREGEDWRHIPMTFDRLVELATEWNKDGTAIPKGAPKRIEILDVLDKTASAKLTASWGVDYFHLAKYDGKWMIVHVLWQSIPKELRK